MRCTPSAPTRLRCWCCRGIIGLMIALPLLTVIADAIGLAGGALLCHYLLDIPLTQYLNRVSEAIGRATFWVGLIKAPVFAVLIALAGTYRGMQVRGSSRELGRLTTVAVVQSIFWCFWRMRCSPCCSWRWTSDGRGRSRHWRCAASVNRFGTQLVHDGLNMRVERRGRVSASSAAPAPANRCCCGPSSACSARRPGTVLIGGRDLAQITGPSCARSRPAMA